MGRTEEKSRALVIGELPAGATVRSIGSGVIGDTPLLVIATDIGVFVCQPGRSKLTKLELLRESW